MKLILTILFLWCLRANAGSYYVANVGSDANSGTIGNPVASIAKANSLAVSGDIIYLNRGDIWHEKVYPVSGVTYDAYGSGALPIVTGFQAVTGWSTSGGNIWTATFSSSVNYQNTVFINGTLQQKGRYPNTGYLNINSHSGANQITGSLSGTPNYTGGEISFRNNHWVTNTCWITNQTGGTFTFSPNSYYPIADNYGYFIKNIPSVLDTLNEWCIDSTTKIISVYATSSPTVKASTIDTLVYCGFLTNISFSNIQFEGANMCAIDVSGSNGISLNNCTIINCGQDGIKGKQTYNLTVQNSTIKNCWNDGLIMLDFATIGNYNDSYGLVFQNNKVDSIGMASGMGKSGNQASTAVDYFGNNGLIQYNTFTNVGYIGTFFQGDSNIVAYNYTDSFCVNKDDGAAYYTNGVGGKYFKGNYIINNFAFDGLLPVIGTPFPYTSYGSSFGIYCDDYAHNVIVANNTISRAGTYGVFMHDCDSISLIGNTMFNNGIDAGTNGWTLGLLSGGAYPNMRITGNKIWSNNNYAFGITTTGNPNTLGVIDSNYYSRYNPNDSTLIKYHSILSLYQWQDSGVEIHSHITPSGITTAMPQLFYNKTKSTVAVPLTGTYTDITGVQYTNMVFIQPFSSYILYKSTTDIPPSYNQKLTQGKFIKVKSL